MPRRAQTATKLQNAAVQWRTTAARLFSSNMKHPETLDTCYACKAKPLTWNDDDHETDKAQRCSKDRNDAVKHFALTRCSSGWRRGIFPGWRDEAGTLPWRGFKISSSQGDKRMSRTKYGCKSKNSHGNLFIGGWPPEIKYSCHVRSNKQSYHHAPIQLGCTDAFEVSNFTFQVYCGLTQLWLVPGKPSSLTFHHQLLYANLEKRTDAKPFARVQKWNSWPKFTQQTLKLFFKIRNPSVFRFADGY